MEYVLLAVIAMLACWYFWGRHLYVGTGVILSRFRDGPDKGKWYIRTRLLKSPADRAGIRIGDIVLRINGLALQEIDPKGIGSYLKRRWGEEVRFTIFRNGRQLEYLIKCEVIQGPIPVYNYVVVTDEPGMTQGMAICKRTGVWFPTQRLSQATLQRIFG